MAARLLIIMGMIGQLLLAGQACADDGLIQRAAATVPPKVFQFQAEDRFFSIQDYAAIDQWGQEIGLQKWTHFRCARLQEQPGVALCLFSHSYLMTAIFGNAAYAIEDGQAARDGHMGLLGIDLRVADLLAYGRTLPPAPVCGGRDDCLPSPELAFLSTILPAMMQTWQIQAVIAAPWGNRSTIEHEILHGQYFSDAAYRQAIMDYWQNGLSERDQSRAKLELSQHYQSGSGDLWVNEFQAYILQSQPGSFLSTLREQHRSGLLAFLQTRQVSPHLRPTQNQRP